MKNDNIANPASDMKPSNPVTAPSSRRPNLSTATLFAKTQELLIEHQGELYCLRLTRNGKLILTK
ncbi:hemin uptake protein HemP [Thermithiobacillus plumbiphilus]|uniref:Hemin uptake protein HemP n=1 Tax=Thermithiobacillus plumbiphilus TaxID=1729899 RepID=A0ABU9D930_9PROT